MNYEYVYPTENRFLRFIGDVLILLGDWIMTQGMRWGGICEIEEYEIDVRHK